MITSSAPALGLRFHLAKYATYLALSWNVYLFMVEEIASARASNVDIQTLLDFIQTYSATIDTAAWLALLLLFELETFVIPDRSLRGGYATLIRLVRLVCMTTIVATCWGYYSEWITLIGSTPLTSDTCAQIGSDWSVLTDLDDFAPLPTLNCNALTDWVVVDGYTRVIATQAALSSAQWLAWVDVVNSSAWILIVILLEIEVRLILGRQESFGAYKDTVFRSKVVLYAVLFAAAIYWAFEGTFLDFWDASLWLYAFFFIERNVVEWRKETVDNAATT